MLIHAMNVLPILTNLFRDPLRVCLLINKRIVQMGGTGRG